MSVSLRLSTPALATGQAPSWEACGFSRRELKGLYQVSRVLGTSLDLDETMALLSSVLDSLVPCSACALLVPHSPAEPWRCRFAAGVDSRRLSRLVIADQGGQMEWARRNGTALLDAYDGCDLVTTDLRSSTRLKSSLIAPLRFKDQVVGALLLCHIAPRFYTLNHLRLIEQVSDHAAAAVHNALLFERTQAASVTDPLTGLWNVRFMQDRVAAEIGRARRAHAEMSLVVMDLDDFKVINDTHGHAGGDDALRLVAGVLRAGLRPYDACARYGGDEFVLLLTGCGREEAESRARAIQDAVNRTTIKTTTMPCRRTTLSTSAGVAAFPADGGTYASLLCCADERMYTDKASRKRGKA